MNPSQPVTVHMVSEPPAEEPVSAVESNDIILVASPKGVGVLSMMLTLIGTRLGAGIVGVPVSTLRLGYVFALCVQVCLIPVGIFSVSLLLSVRELTGRSSFSDIGYYTLGITNIYVINSIIAVGQIGYPIIFFIVWGDAMGGLINKVNSGTFWSSRVFTQGLLGLLLIVLVIQKDISKIKFAGFVILI